MKMSLVILAAGACLVAPSVSTAKAATSAMGEPAKLHCSGHGDAESMTIDEAEASPLYVLLQSKAGDATGCALSRSGGNETFAIIFAKGVTLTFVEDEKTESSNTEVGVPAGSATLSRDEVVKALKAQEKEDNPKGVGMDWAALMAPVPTADADVVAQGRKCNARTHVKYSAGAVVGFGLSSACQEE